MKITPLDIQQMEFKVRFRGYDRVQVDQFLEELADTVEALTRENSALRDKLISTEQHLAQLKKAEATLTNTLVATQALADDLKQAAHRDAELIMKEAELKASEVLREARVAMVAAKRELDDLKKQRLLAIERIRSTLRTFERMIEIEEGEVDGHPESVQAEENIPERTNL